MSFFGREKELGELGRINNQKKASLIVLTGRRRVGKSRLIEHFAHTQTSQFIEIQGLGPRPKQTNQDQLDHFMKKLSEQTNIPYAQVKDWESAFTFLYQQTKSKKVIILLDEISWMGRHDSDFAGKLKVAWDTQFKRNSNLRLVLCGSVSSWIQENILTHTDFFGRISLEIKVEPLPLVDCIQFWGRKQKLVTSYEKLRILSITGGIPLYLEEIDYSRSADDNIRDLFFTKNGLLYKDYEKIFNEIFSEKAKPYKTILESLIASGANLTEISELSSYVKSGALSSYLSDLELSGFITKYYAWDLKTQKQKEKSVVYRISDNYIRFYLKYIDPIKGKIEKGLFELKSLDSLPQWDIILGLQFESLILNNYAQVISKLGIQLSSVINVGPYFQSKTKRQNACQINLLIQTKTNLYVCEIKYRKEISFEIIEEVKSKIENLTGAKSYSIRPVLIYQGKLNERIPEEDFFDKLISFDDLIQKN